MLINSYLTNIASLPLYYNLFIIVAITNQSFFLFFVLKSENSKENKIRWALNSVFVYL